MVRIILIDLILNCKLLRHLLLQSAPMLPTLPASPYFFKFLSRYFGPWDCKLLHRFSLVLYHHFFYRIHQTFWFLVRPRFLTHKYVDCWIQAIYVPLSALNITLGQNSNIIAISLFNLLIEHFGNFNPVLLAEVVLN